MYGGTAKTYCQWEITKPPYKDGKAYYVKVRHPFTKKEVTVRWYTDKAHADLMPPKPKTFGGAPFWFADKDDYIIALPERQGDYLPKDKWHFANIFGGIWYAKKDTPLPNSSYKAKRITWAQFVTAAQEHTRQMFGTETGFWFEQEI